MNPFDSQPDPNHPLHRAYELLFREKVSGELFYLDREELARAFLSRALEVHPDRAGDIGRSRAELAEEFRELEHAFRLLTEVLGTAPRTFVAPFDADIDRKSLERLAEVEVGLRAKSTAPAAWLARPVPEALRRGTPDLKALKAQAEARRQEASRPPKVVATTASEPKSAEPPAPRAAPPPAEPRRHKRFMLGRFLLKNGKITLRQLVDAVLWQRGQRPRVGEIAAEWGIMSSEEVCFVLREKRMDELFCDVAVRLGFMSTFQRLAILARQRRMQSPIGRYFVERGILDEEAVDEAVRTVQRLAREERGEPSVSR